MNREFLLLGLPTWCLMQGSFGVLYKLVDTQPEGFNISTFMMASLTLGNVFALYFGYSHQKLLYERAVEVITCLLITGLLTGLGMSACWWWTVDGVSLPLFVLMFCSGLVSATSNIALFTFVFSPKFLSHKPPTCTKHGEATSLSTQGPAGRTTALATGMALGSGFAGLLALTQGQIALSTPHNASSIADGSGFTVSMFFAVLSMLYVVALYALRLLSQVGRVQKYSDDSSKAEEGISQALLDPAGAHVEEQAATTDSPKAATLVPAERQLLALLVVTGLMGFGVVPSVISGVCGKYQHGSNSSLLFATCMACVGDPLSRMLTSWVRLETLMQLVGMAACCGAMTLALLALFVAPEDSAVFSGRHSAALPAVLYIAFTFCFGFLNTSAFVYINHGGSGGGSADSDSDKQHLSRLASMALQCGAFCGALFVFAFVVTGVLG
jgi:hypothetical protein